MTVFRLRAAIYWSGPDDGNSQFLNSSLWPCVSCAHLCLLWCSKETTLCVTSFIGTDVHRNWPNQIKLTWLHVAEILPASRPVADSSDCCSVLLLNMTGWLVASRSLLNSTLAKINLNSVRLRCRSVRPPLKVGKKMDTVIFNAAIY